MRFNEGSSKSAKKTKKPASAPDTVRASRAKTKRASEASTRKAAETKNPAPGSSGLTTGKKAAIIAMSIVAALFAAAAAGVVYISTLDGIFPNVTIDGTPVGGMSETEALTAISDAGGSVYAGRSIKIGMPMGRTLEIASEDALVLPTAAEAVRGAWEYCHGGSALGNAMTYLRCLSSGAELSFMDSYEVDEAALRSIIENVAVEIEIALMGNDLVIGEDSVRVVKGAASARIDADEVFELAVSLFEQQNFEPAEYAAEISSDQSIDLGGVYDTVYREPQNAYYDGETDEVVPAVVGLSFDLAAAQGMWDAAQYGETIEIPIIRTEPAVSTEYLESMLFRDKLSELTTSLWGSSDNRINNVRKAVEAINGMVLLPGEEFSYNEALGERTPENGYLLAGAYANGEVVSEYGGGICQVSSMVYYCALYANLNITDRTCHMFPVGYMTPGLDATVSWGGPEFKFVNDRDYPVELRAWVTVDDETRSVTVEMHGTDTDGTYVEMNYASWAVFDEEYEEVEVGYMVQTYRSVYDASGSRISRTNEALSRYNYHEEDIDWPSPSPSESPSPSPSEEPSPSPSTTPEATPEPTPEQTPGVTEEPTPPPVTEGPTMPPEETPTPPPESGQPTEPPATEQPTPPPATEDPTAPPTDGGDGGEAPPPSEPVAR